MTESVLVPALTNAGGNASASLATHRGDAIAALLRRDGDLCKRMKGRVGAIKRRYADAAREFAVAARSPVFPFAEKDWREILLRKERFRRGIRSAVARRAAATGLYEGLV
jgi:hypothetical protein